MIQFIRRCPFTGVENSMVLDVTEEQVERWERGMVIQQAMPTLSADEREFIMTGITPEVWNKTFGGE